MAKFCPLFSGSSGNSYLIGGSGGNILIDIGVSAKKTEIALREINIEPASIQAIFITHEHSDHISGLRVFASRYKTPVYATGGTLAALEEAGHLKNIENINRVSIGVEMHSANMGIVAFRTPHDSAQSCGYRITTPDGRKIGIATDIGHMTEEIRSSIQNCDMVIMESNHDVGMLKNGAYPYYLKRRILSDYGHLSNESCADELPKLAESGTTRFILGHLSRENNMPLLAHQTALSALNMRGMSEKRDFLLNIAPVQNNAAITVF